MTSNFIDQFGFNDEKFADQDDIGKWVYCYIGFDYSLWSLPFLVYLAVVLVMTNASLDWCDTVASQSCLLLVPIVCVDRVLLENLPERFTSESNS